jgi:hypothetical protein
MSNDGRRPNGEVHEVLIPRRQGGIATVEQTRKGNRLKNWEATMAWNKALLASGLVLGLAFPLHTASADGIVTAVVNSPLSASGLVRDARVGVNVWLQSEAHPGPEFMNPKVVGYGIPPGGRVEIELGDGFERDPAVVLTQKTLMVVTGTPQQGMPGKAVGYAISEGATPNTIVISPTKERGLAGEDLMSPAPGAKGDPVRQRGIKVFHIGLLESPFINRGDAGSVSVRFYDGAGAILHEGSATADFLAAPVPQIQPNNFPDKQRSHNWQSLAPGQTLGRTPGSLPISYMVYEAPKGVAPGEMHASKTGLLGVGVLSTQQLTALAYEKPAALSRYNGGLILQDSDGDGRLNPETDRIVGGVIGQAPAGATGQELRSLDVHGAADLSKPSSSYHAKFGPIFGGAVGLLQFTAGDKPGLYRPTLALLQDPGNVESGDGSSYTFTIVVE